MWDKSSSSFLHSIQCGVLVCADGAGDGLSKTLDTWMLLSHNCHDISEDLFNMWLKVSSHVPVEKSVDHGEELPNAGRDLLVPYLVLPHLSSCCCCFLHPIKTKVYDRTFLDVWTGTAGTNNMRLTPRRTPSIWKLFKLPNQRSMSQYILRWN